jgi:apolipoprotein N-acyltransferase
MEDHTLAPAFDLMSFSIRSLIDVLSILILVGAIYYPRHKSKDFVFNFVLFNIVNFIICSLLGAAKINVGFAFGLFAMFSIIRYRTIAISIKDMGYFFVSVALGMINALSSIDDQHWILIVCNVLILVLTWGLENLNFLTNENSRDVVYDKVELIKPNLREQLLADLTERIGVPIHKVDIVSIDYLKDVALLKVYHYSKQNETVTKTYGDHD